MGPDGAEEIAAMTNFENATKMGFQGISGIPGREASEWQTVLQVTLLLNKTETLARRAGLAPGASRNSTVVEAAFRYVHAPDRPPELGNSPGRRDVLNSSG